MPSYDFISPAQIELLKIAQNTDKMSVIQAAFLRLIELHAHETIHMDWKTLWKKINKDLSEHCPDIAKEKIEEILQYTLEIDPAIDNIHMNFEDKVCFLVGAGASAPSSIPVTKELLQCITEDAVTDSRRDLDKLLKFCSDNNINDLEALFTAVYFSTFASDNNNIVDLLGYLLFNNDPGTNGTRTQKFRESSWSLSSLQDELNLVFYSLAKIMIPANPNYFHQKLVEFILNHTATKIVTTNYDCIIEEALTKKKIDYNTFLPDLNHEFPSPIAANETTHAKLELLKIHGSINWIYCINCHTAFEKEFMRLKHEYQNDDNIYMRPVECPGCKNSRFLQSLLIPPIGVKSIVFPNLISLWHRAQQAIEEADLLIVIGFSFPEADSYIRNIVEQSMRLNTKQKIIVCNRNTDIFVKLEKRLQDVTHDPHLKDRLFYAHGSADFAVPRLLEKISNK